MAALRTQSGGFFVFYLGLHFMPHIFKDTIAVIGAGTVGTAVGVLLRTAGHPIAAIADRSEEALKKSFSHTNAKTFSNICDAASLAQCILITVSDDAIRHVCDKIAAGTSLNGKKVVHMSGAGGLDLLESAQKAGALVAAIHPIQSFADVEGAIGNIPGSTFGITAAPQIQDWAAAFVKDLGGRPFFVNEEDRPLYHAAACMASNYLVSLMDAAGNIYQHLGLTREEALNAFWPLVKGTLNNIASRGTVDSLTGPIARGDLGTLAKHIAAFKQKMPAMIEVYCVMGAVTVEIALAKGTISARRSEEINRLLKEAQKED
jgi:predicted short-subunit dehydrogenase-like oxidoreductase (DUF2520 family)